MSAIPNSPGSAGPLSYKFRAIDRKIKSVTEAWRIPCCFVAFRNVTFCLNIVSSIRFAEDPEDNKNTAENNGT